MRLAQHESRVDMSIVVEVEMAVGWPRPWDLWTAHGQLLHSFLGTKTERGHSTCYPATPFFHLENQNYTRWFEH